MPQDEEDYHHKRIKLLIINTRCKHERKLRLLDDLLSCFSKFKAIIYTYRGVIVFKYCFAVLRTNEIRYNAPLGLIEAMLVTNPNNRIKSTIVRDWLKNPQQYAGNLDRCVIYSLITSSNNERRIATI